MLDWAPQITFADGMKKTIAWYRENKNYYGDLSAVLVPHPRVGMGIAAHATFK